MSVLRFAEDFSQLVMRYMKQVPLNNNKTKSVIVPLTSDQITFTIHHVLRALGIKDNENDDENDSVTNYVTSNKEIALTSMPPKIDGIEDNVNAYRSQEGSQSVTDSSFSDVSLKAVEKETENSLNTLQSEKKLISRSNPAICVIGRSDTFVCKEEEKANNDMPEDVFENSLSSSSNNNFLQSLEEIREYVINITQKIDNLKRQTCQLTTKQPQQLLSNSLLSLNRSPTIIKKGPAKIRRSMTTFSGTSASSKLHVVEKEDTLAGRRKSISGMASNSTITPRKLEFLKADYSMSKLNDLNNNKASPSLVPKLTKNPKYAHVKSTIPKPIFLNKGLKVKSPE
ncbi:uncharacterized protein [Anoplolepis gracilipes]|uniref:uncharacterized protein n=1 Tax=Anoplolepis gracilipes TaxID=354296 RepID=UPI003BA0D751